MMEFGLGPGQQPFEGRNMACDEKDNTEDFVMNDPEPVLDRIEH